MRAFSTLAFLALPLFSTVLAEESTPPTNQAGQANSIYASAQEAFQDLLNALPEESLQAALSGLKDFKDGVFESHHRGVQRVHDSNPALATKLIVAAVHDLKKRQARPSNGTNPTPPAQSSPPPQQSNPPAQSSQAPPPQEPSTVRVASVSQQPPASSVPRPILVPVEVTTTQSGRVVVQTTAILSEVTASVAVTIVRSNSQGQPVTMTEQRPAIIVTTTDSSGRPTTVTSAANFLPTPGEVLTTTDAQGSTFVTTYTPPGGKISSVRLITTTGADGKPSTITTYTFVDPAQMTGDAAPTSTGRPGLQNGALPVRKNAALEMAALGVGALAMFV